MKKNINLFLNIVELVALIILILLLLVVIKIDVAGGTILGIRNTDIIKGIILYSSLFFEIIVVSVELFLFLTYTLKVKFSYVAFLLFDLIFTLSVNNKFPFWGIGVIVLFCIIKFVIRITLANVIYIPDEIYRYCELYSISIKHDKAKVSKNSAKKVLTNKVKAQNKKSTTSKVKAKSKKSVTTTVSKKKKKAVAA